MKTREELERMTCFKLRVYAREIGCRLGRAASRKADAVDSILNYQCLRADGWW